MHVNIQCFQSVVAALCESGFQFTCYSFHHHVFFFFFISCNQSVTAKEKGCDGEQNGRKGAFLFTCQMFVSVKLVRLCLHTDAFVFARACVSVCWEQAYEVKEQGR